MSRARGASLRDAGWPRGYLPILERGRATPAWKPLRGFAPCGFGLGGYQPWPTISSLLADHVSLQVRSVDPLVLAGVRAAADDGGAGDPVLLDRGFRSRRRRCAAGRSAVDYVNQINQFIDRSRERSRTVRFVKGDVKGEIARRTALARASGRAATAVVMVGCRAAHERDLGVARVARRRPGRASALSSIAPVDLPEQHYVRSIS